MTHSQHSTVPGSFRFGASSLFLLAALFGCGGASPGGSTIGADGRVTFTFDRVPPVGQRFAITSEDDATVQQEISVGGQVVQSGEERTVVSFEGSYTIDALDTAGHVTRRTITVGTFTVRRGEDTSEVLPAGTTFLGVQQGANLVYQSADGTPFDEALQKLAHTALGDGEDPEAPPDAQIWGVTGPVRVGESWPMDARLLAEGMGRSGAMHIDPADVTVRATLVGIEDLDGEQATRLRAELAVSRVEMPLPDGARIQEARMSTQADDLLPVSTTSLRSRGEMRVELDAVFVTPTPGGEATVRMHVVSHHQATTTPR